VSDRLSFRDRVAHFFKGHPGEWVSAYQLAKIGGLYAWRTRVSDCRTELQMVIENRVRRSVHGEAISEYRYVPAADPAPLGQGHDLNGATDGRLI
jgi:hypothetical protein